MGKHSGDKPTGSGFKQFFGALGSGRKNGRHSTPATAAGVLASGSRKPVAAAIAVPTIAAAAVVGVGVGSQQGGSTQQVTSEAAASNVKPLHAENASAKAPKAAKHSSGSSDVELQTPAPKPSTTPADTGSSDSSHSSSNRSSSSGSSGSHKSSGSGSKGSGSKNSGSSGPGGKKNGSASGQGGTCKASYYDTGERTANGETSGTWTAAHKSLPFNSHVKLTNTANGKSITVRVNDRGPYVSGRCFDISPHAMSVLGGDGVATVKWSVQ